MAGRVSREDLEKAVTDLVADHVELQQTVRTALDNASHTNGVGGIYVHLDADTLRELRRLVSGP